MGRWNTIALLSSASLVAAVSTVRGVGPDHVAHYESKQTFSCISDSSITIDFSRVNDDYCDCPDGSDEPGTAACSYLSSLSPNTSKTGKLVLPGFYCANKGHKPAYVSFTRVNDGICDYDQCCDGSDEYGSKKCPDKCKEIGKAWRKAEQERQHALSAGRTKRAEFVKQAVRLRKEVEDRIETLKVEVGVAERKVATLESKLSDAEKRDRQKVVKKPAGESKFSSLISTAKERIEELRENLVFVRHQRDLAQTRVDQLEAILKTFQEEYNPNFNDEGVKRAVRSWEEYAAAKATDPEQANYESDLEEIAKADSETGRIKWDDFEEPTSDVDALYRLQEYLPVPVREWLMSKWDDLRQLLVENGMIAARNIPEGDESQEVADARAAVTSARNELEDVNRKLNEHKTDLTEDYGPDDVFRALKGQSISLDAGEYEYSVIWGDKTVQKSKKNGGDTNMGNFARFEKTAEGLTLIFENGQGCWQGPQRSTTVVLSCSAKDEIKDVREEEKCVYKMHVTSAAVCK